MDITEIENKLNELKTEIELLKTELNIINVKNDINDLQNSFYTLEVNTNSRLNVVEEYLNIHTGLNKIDEFSNDLYDIKQYLNYISSFITKNISVSIPVNFFEYIAHQYYSNPVKDEYGNIVDEPCLNEQINNENLLTIDKNGDIWIDGEIVTSAYQIGNKLLKLASTYKNNIPLNNINDIY